MRVLQDAYQPPARKYEQSATGTASPAVKMGSIFKLSSSVNCENRTLSGSDGESGNGPQLEFLKMICRAAQQYGVMVSDGTGSNQIAFYAENDATADWDDSVGSACSGSGNWSFIVRNGGGSCVGSLSTDGLPDGEGDWQLVAAPDSARTW